MLGHVCYDSFSSNTFYCLRTGIRLTMQHHGMYITTLQSFPLDRTSRTKAPRMFSPSYILALALCFPLFALGSPAVLSHYPLPPLLCNRTLSLVRENAINISTHRSVYAPPTPLPSVLAMAVIDKRWAAGKLARLQRH